MFRLLITPVRSIKRNLPTLLVFRFSSAARQEIPGGCACSVVRDKIRMFWILDILNFVDPGGTSCARRVNYFVEFG